VLLALCLAATQVLSMAVKKHLAEKPKMVKAPDMAKVTSLN